MVIALVALSMLVAFLAFWSLVITIRVAQISKEQKHLETLVIEFTQMEQKHLETLVTQSTQMERSQAEVIKQTLDTLGQFRESITLLAKGGIELSDRVGVIEGEINEQRWDR